MISIRLTICSLTVFPSSSTVRIFCDKMIEQKSTESITLGKKTDFDASSPEDTQDTYEINTNGADVAINVRIILRRKNPKTISIDRNIYAQQASKRKATFF